MIFITESMIKNLSFYISSRVIVIASRTVAAKPGIVNKVTVALIKK